jgi:hypothetical protein
MIWRSEEETQLNTYSDWSCNILDFCMVVKNVGFQKLDLNLIAYEIIKGVFFSPSLKS